MVKVSSSLILEELAAITVSTVDSLERSGRIKTPLHKEVLKFESTALVFWLFRGSNIFPEIVHKLILDEMHEQYYARLKKHGYSKNLVQAVCDDFNLRYKTYDKYANDMDNFVKIGTSFEKFVSERAKTDLDVSEMTIPIELFEKTAQKFEEFRNTTKE